MVVVGLLSGMMIHCPSFFSDLIGDLRDEVWRLKGARTKDVVEEQTMTKSVILALQEQLKEKSAEIDAVRPNI